MKRLSLSLLGVLALLAAACGGGGATTTTSATTTTAAPTPTAAPTTTAASIELLVWADANRAAVVEAIAPVFAEETGVTVTVEIVDFGEIRSQVQTAAPAGEGPDIFIGASDWVGELATNGVIEPLDLGADAADFTQASLDAVSFGGTLYGLPHAVEAIALYYNTDLVPEAPATFEEIPAICDALADISNCVGVPGGGDGTDPYHQYPFLSATGGYIFGVADGVYDTADVGLDSEGAIAGGQFLEGLIDDGVVGSLNYDGAKNLFLEGTEPFWITGPWEVGTLSDQDTVNWAVAKIPTIAGGTPSPFIGVQAFFLNAFSENKVVAQSFLLDFVATPETMAALYEADPRPPVYSSVIDAVADDPVASAFGASAADGQPIPNIPEMGSIWGPWGDNMLLLRNGELSAEEALTNAATAVREALGS